MILSKVIFNLSSFLLVYVCSKVLTAEKMIVVSDEPLETEGGTQILLTLTGQGEKKSLFRKCCQKYQNVEMYHDQHGKEQYGCSRNRNGKYSKYYLNLKSNQSFTCYSILRARVESCVVSKC